MIILASASPRRTEILTLGNIDHKVIPSTCKEEVDNTLKPFEVVESLSYQKAYDVYKKNESDTILGADTIVVIDNIILGKPKDEDDAIKMLKMLSGKVHEVITGVTIMNKSQIKTFHEITYVYVNELTDCDILNYIEEENVYDKAGSYAIQGIFKKHISKIEGEYYNVVGLPLKRLKKELKEFNNEI